MARSVEEWIADTDDQRAPPRIRFLTERDRKNAELEQYVKDQRRRQFIAKVKRVLWWRG